MGDLMTLQEYLRVVRAHWLVIAVLTVLGGALAFGWTLLQPKVYTANASALVTESTAGVSDSTILGNDAESNVKSYVDIAKSRTVAARAGEIIGTETSPQELLLDISVANPSDTAVLRVYAHGPSPEYARDLADAWITAMTEVVAEIESESPAADGEAATSISLRPLDPAALPTQPSSPKEKLAIALGLVVGLVVGLVYAVIRSSQDRRLRQPADVERVFGLPVVGALPFDNEIAKMGVAAARSDFAMKEAVRQLRTNLQFVDVDNPPRVIVITSSSPGDGKSTSATKLAEAIAESGRDVVLVDADLRRPAVASNLGLPDAVGLTDVLVGRVRIEEALQRYGDTGHLEILAAGAIPPNPSELLGSNAMHELLYSFDGSKIVLVDSPPLLPVTDAAVLTARTDGALVVARAGRTTIDELGQAIEDLEKVKGRAIGVILDAVPRRGAYRGAYMYAYERSGTEKGGKRKGKAKGAAGREFQPESESPVDSLEAYANEPREPEPEEKAAEPVEEAAPDHAEAEKAEPTDAVEDDAIAVPEIDEDDEEAEEDEREADSFDEVDKVEAADEQRTASGRGRR
mgnify:CR=1 FL=1